MRQDQYLKLQALAERIADVAISDADPTTWAGAGLTSGLMTSQQRGDAYWSRKMAVSTISVLQRVQGLIHSTQQAGDVPPPLAAAGEPVSDEDSATRQLDEDIRLCEKEASELLDTMTLAAKKRTFDNRTHGKP